MRDKFGSPMPHAIGHATVAYPVLFRATANGSIPEVLFHVNESSESKHLKRGLVSALQIAQVEPTAVASGQIQFSVQEEDRDGTFLSEYRVRRGLVGRMAYNKQSVYAPTRQRPPEIVQGMDSFAIFDKAGTLIKLTTSLHFETNFSASLKGDDDATRRNISGLERLPKHPSTFTWTLQRPTGGGISGLSRSRRRMQEPQNTSAFHLSSFVSSRLFVEEPLSEDELDHCHAFANEAPRQLKCLLAPATAKDDDATRLNCSSTVIRGAMLCPALGIESKLADVLMSSRCLGIATQTKHLCYLLVMPM